jgi:hypothetical protein
LCFGFSLHFSLQNTFDDRLIPGTATEIAIQCQSQICFAGKIQLFSGHNHAGGAIAALKALFLQKCLLHWGKLSVLGKSFDRCDGTTLNPLGRIDATMDRHIVYPDRASATVASFTDAVNPVATLLMQQAE